MAKKSSTSGSLKKIRNHQIPETLVIDRTAELETLFYENIKCLYWVENHLLIALPKMIAASGKSQLQQTLEGHLAVTKSHASRLEEIFKLMERQPLAKKSDALEGLVMDGEHIIEETMAGSEARNTGLIMAGQLVENYEITAYTGIIKLATELGHTEMAKILSQTLAEEQEAQDRLTALGEA